MGHESPIQPWWERTTELLVGFRTDWLRREEAMKTAGRGTQNCYAKVRSKPSSLSGRLEQLLLNYTGWKARKNPAAGELFFLAFLFIKLIGTYPTCNAEGKSENSFRVVNDSAHILRFRRCPFKVCRYSPNPSIPSMMKSEMAEISLKGGN